MTKEITAEVCVAGGGPAGIMLGLLLARAGVEVVVLERHADFFRDFRGDTVHPSTLNLIDQLGLRVGFEKVPHTRMTTIDFVVNGVRLHPVDLRMLPKPNREIALMPQWDLLDLLASEGRRHDGFHLLMATEATDVVRDHGRVAGVRATGADGEVIVHAPVTIAADGRGSTVREALGLAPVEYGVPIDVLWLRLPRPTVPVPDTLGYVSEQQMLITIPRPDYIQCGVLIPKGAFEQIKAAGLEPFRDRIADTAPPLREVVGSLTDWDDVKLLTVQVNRLPHWSSGGALCIGDAAHAMSPAFGVGINYAVQDAVATANTLVPVLRTGTDPARLDEAFAHIEKRRTPATARMQRIQLRAHQMIAGGSGSSLFTGRGSDVERIAARTLLPVVRPLTARLIGYGFRPERIDPEILSAPPRPSGEDSKAPETSS